jgi:hypothetical protein
MKRSPTQYTPSDFTPPIEQPGPMRRAQTQASSKNLRSATTDSKEDINSKDSFGTDIEEGSSFRCKKFKPNLFWKFNRIIRQFMDILAVLVIIPYDTTKEKSRLLVTYKNDKAYYEGELIMWHSGDKIGKPTIISQEDFEHTSSTTSSTDDTVCAPTCAGMFDEKTADPPTCEPHDNLPAGGVSFSSILEDLPEDKVVDNDTWCSHTIHFNQEKLDELSQNNNILLLISISGYHRGHPNMLKNYFAKEPALTWNYINNQSEYHAQPYPLPLDMAQQNMRRGINDTNMLAAMGILTDSGWNISFPSRVFTYGCVADTDTMIANMCNCFEDDHPIQHMR